MHFQQKGVKSTFSDYIKNLKRMLTIDVFGSFSRLYLPKINKKAIFTTIKFTI